MSTSGLKPVHTRLCSRRRCLVRIILILLLAAGIFVTVKSSMKIKKLFQHTEELYRMFADADAKSRDQFRALTREIEVMKLQAQDHIPAQESSRREIDRLQLVIRRYEAMLEDFSARYHHLEEINQQLKFELRSGERRNAERFSELEDKMSRVVDLESLKKEIKKIMEDLTPKQVSQEIADLVRMIQDINRRKEEVQVDFRDLDPFDAEEHFESVQDKEEAYTNEVMVNTDLLKLFAIEEDEFIGSDDISSDLSSLQEHSSQFLEELRRIMNAHQEEHNNNDMDPFSIEFSESDIRPKLEAHSQIQEIAEEIPNPLDPFYIEDREEQPRKTIPEYCEGPSDVCSPLDALFKDVSSWREKYSKKIQEFAKASYSATKEGFQAVKSFVRENTKGITREAVKQQAGKLADKAKELKKSVLSWFRR